MATEIKPNFYLKTVIETKLHKTKLFLHIFMKIKLGPQTCILSKTSSSRIKFKEPEPWLLTQTLKRKKLPANFCLKTAIETKAA